VFAFGFDARIVNTMSPLISDQWLHQRRSAGFVSDHFSIRRCFSSSTYVGSETSAGSRWAENKYRENKMGAIFYCCVVMSSDGNQYAFKLFLLLHDSTYPVIHRIEIIRQTHWTFAMMCCSIIVNLSRLLKLALHCIDPIALHTVR